MPSALTDETLSPETLATLDRIIARNAEQPGALIPILQETQELIGYLPSSATARISAALNLPISVVAGVITFYSYFSTVPRGRHTIRVCLGTACYVRGGGHIVERIGEALGITVGDTTEDRVFSLEIGRCFGACGLAPVVVVDGDTHQRVNPVCAAEILAPYREDDDE